MNPNESAQLPPQTERLSTLQRFWGFGICVAVGFLLSFGVRLPTRRLGAGLGARAVIVFGILSC
eukprot:SAG31_NODE_499_length_14841_cov_7.930471_13_plen_64_part_00